MDDSIPKNNLTNILKNTEIVEEYGRMLTWMAAQILIEIQQGGRKPMFFLGGKIELFNQDSTRPQ